MQQQQKLDGPLTLERAERTVVRVHTAFFLEFFCAELLLLVVVAPSDGFLLSSESAVALAVLGACLGRGMFLAGTFLAGFGTAGAALC